MRSIRAKTDRAVIALAMMAATALVACEPSLPTPIPGDHDGDVTPVRGGILRLSSFGDIRALDPANISDGLVGELHQLIFSGLVDFDEKGEIVPDLAESFHIDDGGKTYTFTLHQGVRFHTGEELTAEDVKRSAERALHPSAPNPFSTFYSNIVGFEDFQAKKAAHLEGVVVDGRYVVTFHLREPDATFLALLAIHELRPVCPNAGDRYSDTWKACGAGPFKLLSWDRGQRVVLGRHEGYWRPGLPTLDGVTMTFLVNVATEKYKFARGEIDVLREFQQPELVRFQSDPRWLPFGQYESERQLGGEMMNTEMAPFSNIEVRRAVAAGIDREHIRLVKPSNLSAANQPIPPSSPFHDSSLEGQKYDYQAALDHMKKAGYPYDPVTGKGGYPDPIPYLVYRQSINEYTAQVVAQDLAKIGIRIDLQVVNYATYLALVGRRKTTTMSLVGWNQDYPDPADFTDTLFHSRSLSDEDSNNYAFYSNPHADALMDAAKREVNFTRRKALYREVQQTICDDAPWAFTFYYRNYDVHQPYVKNYRAHPVWPQNVRDAWLDHAASANAGSVSSLERFGFSRGAAASLGAILGAR